MEQIVYYLAKWGPAVSFFGLFGRFILCLYLFSDISISISHLIPGVTMKSQNTAAQFSLSREQIIQMISLGTSRDRALICLMGLNGLRRAEAVTLQHYDIDWVHKRLSFEGKGLKRRIVPFDKFSSSILNNYSEQFTLIERDTNGPLFPSRNSATGVLNLNNVNRIVAKAGRLAGVTNPDPTKKYINPHILRHSYAHYLKINNVPLEVIQDLLGHSSIQTTADTYGRRSIEEIQEILKKV